MDKAAAVYPWDTDEYSKHRVLRSHVMDTVGKVEILLLKKNDCNLAKTQVEVHAYTLNPIIM